MLEMVLLVTSLMPLSCDNQIYKPAGACRINSPTIDINYALHLIRSTIMSIL